MRDRAVAPGRRDPCFRPEPSLLSPRALPWTTAGAIALWALACANSESVDLEGPVRGEGGSNAPVKCGDGECNGEESCDTCATDCCAVGTCGDGICSETESCADCLEDCGDCPGCGDRVCADDESCSSCPVDCGECPPSVCGDGTCDPTEDCAGCPDDCGACPVSCGDGTCDPVETCDNCPGDCGDCPPACGDGRCNGLESCTDCPGDCGACPPSCGDATCNATESCSSCPADCGICPCVADGFEPNNGSPTATSVTPGITYCGLSICTGDVDWLEFPVTSSLTATITFTHALGDLELEIYSAATLDYVDGSYSGDDDETVTLTGLSPGTYWARVYGAGGDKNPAYCFVADEP